MHLYLAANCLTPGCKQTLILKYLGKKGKIGTVGARIPTTLLIQCPACLETHDYHDEKLHSQLESSDPPAADFSDKF